ncbi:MAG: recombination protein RecR [Clostridia bacterium]|nr:recombination protein RecR [Clostridia bacterium]
MADYILPLEQLIEQFARLPGVGRKTASRYALSLIDWSDESARTFAETILSARSRIGRCKVCNNLCEGDTCNVCKDTSRDPVICVVEDARAVMSLERVRDYRGRYHVLGGVLSPMNGIGPDQLAIDSLLARLNTEEIEEVIVATNPTVEGEATALYLQKLLKPLDIKVTRLAYGVPVGADLEYADAVTLFRALDGRREL